MARTAAERPINPDHPQRIIIHWAAASKTTRVEDIERWHLKRGWHGIGYHRVILYPLLPTVEKKWSDLVKLGRDDKKRGAHTLNHNKGSLGICVIGNTDYLLHPLQAEALKETCRILALRYQIEPFQIKGHRDYNKTQCPGDEIYAFLPEVRKYVEAAYRA